MRFRFDFPRMCVPNLFNINQSFKKSLNGYCKQVVADFFEERAHSSAAAKKLL